MNEIRLNKALAQAGVCSRRKADELMIQGRVKVNGLIAADLGLKVDPTTDTIQVDGKPVTFAATETPVYLMLHKPSQVVSTVSDPQNRPTVLSILPQEFQQYRLYPVGRLDFFSEGLLVLTNDGELTHRMTHPRYHLDKEYEVSLREPPQEKSLAVMREGMTLAEGDKLAPVDVQVENNGKRMRMVLRQGINRQIRRMCRDLGLTILRLKRVRTGPIYLGDLPHGKCRALFPAEVARLRKALGL